MSLNSNIWVQTQLTPFGSWAQLKLIFEPLHSKPNLVYCATSRWQTVLAHLLPNVPCLPPSSPICSFPNWSEKPWETIHEISSTEMGKLKIWKKKIQGGARKAWIRNGKIIFEKPKIQKKKKTDQRYMHILENDERLREEWEVGRKIENREKKKDMENRKSKKKKKKKKKKTHQH